MVESASQVSEAAATASSAFVIPQASITHCVEAVVMALLLSVRHMQFVSVLEQVVVEAMADAMQVSYGMCQDLVMHV